MLLSCVIFVGYMSREAARHSIRNQWVYILALLLAGLSFAWPLFLFKLEAERESKLVETASTETRAAANR
ncbi:MAG: hypothetical protein DMF61_24990 [Blastocatellia bacterium AA13]|nr:MAG: hypothetical protein DMF61_24990 [Blastocatellia bacterium AA13]